MPLDLNAFLLIFAGLVEGVHFKALGNHLRPISLAYLDFKCQWVTTVTWISRQSWAYPYISHYSVGYSFLQFERRIFITSKLAIS
jgi:hypothetical protein